MKQKLSLTFLFYSIFIFCALLLSACTNFANNKYQHVFKSVGYAPIAAQKGGSFDLQMLNAIKVSKLEAYKEMAEQVNGVFLSAETNVEGARLQNDVINSRVKGLVRGARVLKSYHEGDMYITELELDLKNLNLLEERDFNKRTIQVINTEEQVYY